MAVTRKKGRRTHKIYNMSVERQTICIPHKLRKRMVRYQDRNHVNWSSIAAQAFREHMKEFPDGEPTDQED